MTTIFHNMMHCKMEDYIDDIVVKSRKHTDHVKVLRKVFKQCRLFKLRINPLKCDFGVSTGKFIGFLGHSRGKYVDQAKAIAIATTKPPFIVNKLKSFLGKVSYIRRFILGLCKVIEERA